MRFALEAMAKPEYYHSGKEANHWWMDGVGLHASWNAEFIQQTEFRKSDRQEPFVLCCDKNEQLEWSQLDTTRQPYQYISTSMRFQLVELTLAKVASGGLMNRPLTYTSSLPSNLVNH